MKPIMIYASNTGNTETFANWLKGSADIDVGTINSDISKYDKIVLGAYTWSVGLIPTLMKQFLIDNQKNFEGKKVYIFGSGNSVYRTYCKAVDSIDKIVTDCGAEVMWKVKFEQRFDPTIYGGLLDDLIKKLNG